MDNPREQACLKENPPPLTLILMYWLKPFFTNLQVNRKTWTQMYKPQFQFNVLVMKFLSYVISTQDPNSTLCRGSCIPFCALFTINVNLVWNFVILCINCRRKVLVDHDLNLLCSCITTCFPILGDKSERIRIRESRTYLLSAIWRSISHPRFNCYAIVL